MYAFVHEDDAGAWRYLGERPGSMRVASEGRPSTLLTVSGWAVAAESGAASLQIQTYSGVRAELAADAEDVDFIDACLAEGLHCWITGMLVVLPRVSSVSCEHISVWSTRPDIAGRLSTGLMRAIAEAARDMVLHNFMERAPTRTAGAARHPMVFAGVMRYVEARPEASRLFAKLEALSHYELVAASKIPALRVEHLSPIGASGASFCHLTNTVFLREVLLETTSHVVGGIVLGEDTQQLLELLGHHVHIHGHGDSTLVVAPRSAVPSTVAALRRAALDPCLVWTTRAASSFVGASVPTVVTPEMSLLLPNLRWRRIFYVGWPAAFVQGLEAECHLALGIEHEVSAAAAERRLFLARLTQLFLLSPDVLQNAPTLERLLAAAVHRDGPPADFGVAVRKYAYSHPPAPARHADGATDRDVFLEPLVEGLRRFPASSDAARFFAGRALSAYAQESLAAIGGTCPVCLEDRADTVTRCGHWFCASCLSAALRRSPSCPVCKQALRREKDAVTLSSSDARPAPTEELLWLAERLGRRVGAGGKLALFAAFAQAHEAFGAFLRAQGVSYVASWRGNARQLLQTFDRFNAAASGVLLVDSSRLDLRWVRFEGVAEVWIMQPLSGPTDPCCQLRQIVNTCPSALHVEVVGVSPEPCIAELPVCEFRHLCPVMVRATHDGRSFNGAPL